MWLQPHACIHSEVQGPDLPIFALLGVVAYGIAVCYTGGWLSELAVRRILPSQSERLSIATFRAGLVFSILLSLVPGFVFGVFGVIAAWPHILGRAPH
jgi:hypothetical protein